MNRIFAIALNTFREAMRDKLLYAILIFACLLILSAWGIGQLSMHEELRITKDVGLGGISVFGVILAIFAGVNLVYKEIERKTLYAFIPKPIHRWQFVLGKYLGLVLTLTAQVALMSVVLWITMAVQGWSPDGVMVRAVLLLYVQVLLVTAIAVFFSTFSTPYLSGLFTAGIFIIGRSTPDLRALILARFKDSPSTASALNWAIQVLPDLHLFFVSGGLVNGVPASIHAGSYVSWAYVAGATGYGLGYSACVLALAIFLFSRRDFV
ncbi:MAG: ABC transporter permease [Myxococcales bacterium]|nr:ABC transporter permease [Myxococcales bacterium]